MGTQWDPSVFRRVITYLCDFLSAKRPTENQEEYQPIISESDNESENGEDSKRLQVSSDGETTTAEISDATESDSISEICEQEAVASKVSSQRSSPLLISEEEKIINLSVKRKTPDIGAAVTSKIMVTADVYDNTKSPDTSNGDILRDVEEVEEEKVPIVPKLNLESDVEVSVFPVSEVYSLMGTGKLKNGSC